MKITPPNATMINQAYSNPSPAADNPQASRRNTETAKPTAPAMDSVSLSVSTKDLQTVRNAMDNTPESRADLIERLKSQIQEGTYTVNAEKIAEKMMTGVIDQTL